MCRRLGEIFYVDGDLLNMVVELAFCCVLSVSPPGGDFSDPVTSATLGIVQVSKYTVIQLWTYEISPSVRCKGFK